jgi:hypothetical protein
VSGVRATLPNVRKKGYFLLDFLVVDFFAVDFFAAAFFLAMALSPPFLKREFTSCKNKGQRFFADAAHFS